MKYVIKKVLIGFLIGALLMIFSNAVKADSFHKENISSPTCNRGSNCTSFTTAIDYIIPASASETSENFEINISPVDISSYSGFIFTTYINYYDSDYSEVYSETPSEWTCSAWGSGLSVITYADGTQANVSGAGVCNEWDATSYNSVNYSLGTLYDTGFMIQAGYRYNSSNSYQQCFIQSSSGNSITWNCPRTSNGGINTISQLKFNIKRRSDNPIYFYLNSSSGLQLYNSADNRIISNMNNVTNLIIEAIENSGESVINAIVASQNATTNAINANTQATQQQTQTMTDSSTTGANADADALKNNAAFDDSSGIQSLITLPLRFVNNLGTACSPIDLTIPYMNANVTIPCMRSVISSKMPALSALITAVVNGFLLYNIFIQIVDMIHGAKNPDDDRLEVVEL